MNRRAIVSLVTLISVLSPACRYTFVHDEAAALVKRVGAGRIVRGVEALRSLNRSQKREVPRSQWPDAIKALEPQGVFVDQEGVWVAKSSGYIEGEGLLIVFPGEKEPEEHWGDPSIWRVEKGIFWYQFTG